MSAQCVQRDSPLGSITLPIVQSVVEKWSSKTIGLTYAHSVALQSMEQVSVKRVATLL